MCAKISGKTRARDDMKLIRSCRFGLENTITGCQAKNPNPVGFCELLSVRTAENDELDGVWDLARLTRDVRVWKR